MQQRKHQKQTKMLSLAQKKKKSSTQTPNIDKNAFSNTSEENRMKQHKHPKDQKCFLHTKQEEALENRLWAVKSEENRTNLSKNTHCDQILQLGSGQPELSNLRSDGIDLNLNLRISRSSSEPYVQRFWFNQLQSKVGVGLNPTPTSDGCG